MILIIRLKMHFVTKMLYLVDKNYRYKGGINVGIQNFFFQAEVGGGQLFEFPGGGGGDFEVDFGQFYIVI